MKPLLFTIILIFISITSSVCQIPVKKLNSQEKSVIVEYINNAKKNNLFFQDKGVVRIKETFNDEHEKIWAITLIIDADLSTNYPTAYTKYRNEVIFFYEKGVEKKESIDSLKTNSFLNELVGDRLFASTLRKNRPMIDTVDGFIDSEEILNKEKKTKVITDSRNLSFDGDRTGLYVLFKKNGMIAKSVFGIPSQF